MANTTSQITNKPDSAMGKKVESRLESLEKMSREAGEKAGRVASNITDSASGYMKASRDFVKENPVKGVAIAAAAGALAGGIAAAVTRRKH